MNETPNLNLPYLLAAQAQKHVTHNEAIRALDAIVQLSVLDRNIAAPPATPAEGDRYIVDSSPSGAWTGQAGNIAAYQDGTWIFYVPKHGWVAWVADENALVAFDGSGWTGFSGGGGVTDHGALTGLGDDDHPQYHTDARGDARYTPTNPAAFGINATADTTNRLAVASAASLFNHAGNGHQVKVNKAAAADTASFVFQTAFSGRAEIGLTGDDDFHFKVSADGAAFNEAIVIDKATGACTFPNTSPGGGAVGENLLINGDFHINQRQFAGGALTAGVYGFDRWKAAAGGANVSVAGFTVTLTSGELEQVIEPSMFGLASFASLQVTASVEAPDADLTATFGSQSGNITAGSGRRTVTLTLAAGDVGNLSFKLKKASGSGVTFARVKLEVGASATGWQARPHEFVLTQRFFERRRYTSGALVAVLAARTSVIAQAVFTIVEKRVVPAVTASAATDFDIYGVGGEAFTLSFISTTKEVALRADLTTGSLSSNGAYLFAAANANAVLDFDAEL